MAPIKNLVRWLPALALSLAVAGSAHAEGIGPGSPAPKLDVKTWYKGAPITEFSNDKIYVVEFWATWCGPCKTSIPHLTETAHKNKDVTFIGVSIWEDDVDGNIANFVKEMGDKMDYNVGYSSNKGGMAETWMAAAGQNGIPSSFIIKEGKIQWVGHPMSIDKPLEEIKAGTFDMAAFKVKFDKNAEASRASMALNKRFTDATAKFTAGKRQEAHAALDAIIKENPKSAPTADRIKFGWLAIEDPKAWETQAKKMAESKNQDQIMQVCSFAYGQVKGAPAQQEQARQALGWVLKATENKDLNVLSYASAFYNGMKDYKMALEMTNAIIAALPNSEMKDNADYMAAMVKQKKDLEEKITAQNGGH